MTRGVGAGAVFAVLAAVACPLDGHAQMFVATGRDTLRGLPGVEVLVEPLEPELERRGLASADIAASVVEQLKTAAIQVYPSQRENPSPSKPYVYVHVTATATERRDTVAVGIQLHLRQTLASLTTESRVVNAMSWDAHDVVVVPVALLKEDVSAQIRRLVERFIADWRAVH